MTVLGAQGVEEGTQQAGALYLEGVRDPAACVEAVAEGSCYNLEADTPAASWAVGRRREEGEDLEVVLQVAGRRGGDTAGLGVRSWAAWGRRRDLLSSSWTAGSGNLRQTCRSWWWT